MSDEKRLPPPLEGHVLALRDVIQLDLYLGHVLDCSVGRQLVDEGVDGRLGDDSTGRPQSRRHQVGEALPTWRRVRALGCRVLNRIATVEGEVRDLHVGVTMANWSDARQSCREK